MRLAKVPRPKSPVKVEAVDLLKVFAHALPKLHDLHDSARDAGVNLVKGIGCVQQAISKAEIDISANDSMLSLDTVIAAKVAVEELADIAADGMENGDEEFCELLNVIVKGMGRDVAQYVAKFEL